ncbi:CRTAC1 family protein [Paracoccaceae bacterium Fryx2]|nr:CRTAC1 family protein [Paracoccaceae bacterium Fryx2]
MRRPALALLLAAATPAQAQAPAFVEDTATSGIAHSFEGGWEFIVGGGVAAFDCDGDGRPDLALAGGTAPAMLYRNRSHSAGPLRFDAEPGALGQDSVSGAYPLDIDSDGITDLVLLRVGANIVLRGLGDCRFERANEAWGFDGGDAWSTAFAATWEAGAGWPTLAIGNYIDRREESFPWGSCTDNWLHRPGTVGFAPPLPLTPSHCALSMLFTDWNRSGTPSLRVSNDREYYKGGQEQLWRLPPGAPPALWTEAEGWQRLRIWGMGIASRDLDGDGYPEYFLTSMADNKLQTLKPTEGAPIPTYADVAFARGVTAHRPHTGGDIRPSTAWHAQFEDVNNDGRPDLFIAKGNVWDMPDFAEKDPDNLLMQGPDGIFTEAAAAAGVAGMGPGRGAALADFNLDGRVDLVVVNRNAPSQIWRNVTPDVGHWLQIRPQQPAPNRDAIGGWIEVRSGGLVQRRELTAGGGHAGGQTGWWHFGLGAATTAEARILWPDGTAGDWQAVSVDGFRILERGRPAQDWRPPNRQPD